MTHVYIEDLASHVGETITLKGWLYNRRGSKKIHFLEVRDGTGIVQGIVSKRDASEELFELCGGIQQETSIIVTGEVKAHPKQEGVFELGVASLEVVARPTQEYPITPKEHGTDFLMDNRHLWLRSKRQHAVLRVRAEIISAVRDYFNGNGFTLVDAPIFTPNACEGTSTLFETDYHGDPAYLTQSGQLYMEAAAAAVGKAYCFGPTFRAEKSKTRRHLAEFWMVEPEVAYMDLAGDVELAEDFVRYIVRRVVKNRRQELTTLERDIEKLEAIDKPFPRITYDEAVEIIRATGREFEDEDDFGAPDETIIGEKYDTPVIVTHYPMQLKAFYFKADPENPKRALCMDMIAPEGYGEIIGGGEREDGLTVLENAIEHHKLPREAFEWYLDVRRYGSFPHAGFGLGIERTVAWLCGLSHVRETIPFPRMLNRLSP